MINYIIDYNIDLFCISNYFQVKAEATGEIHRPASAIVETAILQHADPQLLEGSRPNLGYLIRTANRIRQQLRPAEPSDLDFEVYKYNINYLY